MMRPYERKARLTPGLLLVLPISVTLATLGADKNILFSSLVGLLAAAGGPFVLMTLVASSGRRLEPNLHRRWGGTPSNQLLRIHSDADSETQRQLWRKDIQSVTGVMLNSSSDELKSLPDADARIRGAFGQVKYIGQDEKQFPVPTAENAQYGFERNMFAVRHFARFLGLACAALLLVCMVTGVISSRSGIVGIAANALIAVGWFVIPSEQRAREAGFRYATQVLNVVSRLAKEKR